MAALGYARPSRGTFGQVVPLDDRDSLDVVAEGLGGGEAGELAPTTTACGNGGGGGGSEGLGGSGGGPWVRPWWG